MSQRLDGARLKVIRAQEHLDSLKSELGMYLHEQPQEVRSKPARGPHSTYRAVYAAYYANTPLHELPLPIPGEPPLRLSTIIGDCLTNARAALDYIGWELTQRYFDPPFDIGNDWDRKLTAFPLYTSPKAALKKRTDALEKRHVPTDAITEIQAVQPYNTGYESLGWLHELVNRDKHRMPLLTIGEYDEMTVTLAQFPLRGDIGDIINGTSTRGPISFSIERHPTTGEQSTLQSDVQMKGEVTIYVTWQDVTVPHEPVERTLEQIIKTVANTIPRFDRFF